MGKVINKTKFLALLAMMLLVFGCDPEELFKIDKLSNLEYSESNGIITLGWDTHEDAICYMIFVDGLRVRTIPYLGNVALLDADLEDGTVITVEGYSDMAEILVVVKGEITYKKSEEDRR
ncbi:hypothetical protein ACT29H_02765 [Thermophagus sp. OGC60D27]|uniref:hypothetical protein n=1 Tax=Thermophagus sp. OGC60D27 TaxID=3458415 RepID=UPI0040381DF3